MQGTPFDTGLDLRRLKEIADYFYEARKKYAEFESPVNNQVKADILSSQVPGGMLSHLVAQLRQQKAEDKLDAVMAEMTRVRKDMGYPPLVAPTSQMVGSQATLNVITGKRYAVVSQETRNYLLGHYGESPGPIDAEVRKAILGKKEPITCRPADLLKPGLERARQEIGSLAASDEDVLSYALFPEVAKEYFHWRDAHNTPPS